MTTIVSSSYSLPNFQVIETNWPKGPLQRFRDDPSKQFDNETVSIKMSGETPTYTYKKEDPKRFIFSDKDWNCNPKKNEKEQPQEKKPKIVAKILRPLEFVNQLKIRENMSYTGLVIEGTTEAIGPGLLTFANGECASIFLWSPQYSTLRNSLQKKERDTWLKVSNIKVDTLTTFLNKLELKPLPTTSE